MPRTLSAQDSPAGRRSAIVVRTSREARHGIGAGVLVSRCPAATQTVLDQLARYLGLVGLTALFVGGDWGCHVDPGVSSGKGFHAIAILKTLGADNRIVIQAYLAQAVGLGLAGSLIGLLLGMALQQMLPGVLATLLASDLLGQIEYAPAFSSSAIGPLVKGVGLGVLTTLFFSLWPLLRVREVKPAAIFRREVEVPLAAHLPTRVWFGRRWFESFRRDPIPAGTALIIGAGLAALSMWQSGSWMVGLLFIGGLLIALTALVMSARSLLAGISRLPPPDALVLRHALGNLHRPGSQALGVMVSIGVGVMVIMTIGVIEHSLIHNISEHRPADSPTFFFIDIQPDQTDRFSALVHEQTGKLAPHLTPLVRARVRAINGQAVKTEASSEQEEQASQTREDKRKNWYLSREYALTFLAELPKDNQIIQGAWWKPGEVASRPFVSVEEEAARYMGLSVGSIMDLDIQGTSVEAEVASIRKVEWGNFSTNFYMILSPGSLDDAPMTYVGTVRVSPDEEVPLQTRVVATLPNVTAINIGDVMATFARVLERLALAIRAVALFCILAGALVMAAALTATRYQRLYEAVVLKALGATRGLIAQAFAVEYALLGCVAGTVGIVLANGLAWATLRYVLDLPWSLVPSLLAMGLAGTILLTMAVGFLSTYRLLGQRPLRVLRQE
ncbi:MAG: FtsX-like permease family protein [Nitrospiraceae bacterium]